MSLMGLKHMSAMMFSRRWWPTTLLVIGAMAVMTRLGYWQLDRLEFRRARNAYISNQLSSETLLLSDDDLDYDISRLEYRPVAASGSYDHSREIILKGQLWGGQPGVHIITPLILSGSNRAVLVDRGWIPYEDSDPNKWEEFAEPGPVTVTGLARSADTPPRDTPSNTPQHEWYRVDIAALQIQMPYNLLPFYVQQSPRNEGNNILPLRTQPTFDLSDGPHLGYAIQWYLFVTILGVGYVYYLRKNSSYME